LYNIEGNLRKLLELSKVIMLAWVSK